MCISGWSSSSPFKAYCMIKAGITMDTNEGANISVTTPSAVITPLFHSMMVVTSPIGENAPPELAAMMTSDAKTMRSL